MDVPHGKVQTVLGPVDPSTLGPTLTHEHLSHGISQSVFFVPLPANLQNFANVPFTLENICWIKQYPYSYPENVVFNDVGVHQAVLEELRFFKSNGGGTIVENTILGCERNVPLLKKLSNESGVNIVAGTGFYVSNSQPPEYIHKSVEELSTMMKNDLLRGADGTDAKCGVIGELGCSFPLSGFEKKVLQASGMIQSELGCPVIIHPGRDKNSPYEIMRIFQEAGGCVSKTVMSHLERTILNPEGLAEFASLGSYCEFDLFGTEVSLYQLNPSVDMPSDATRVKHLKYLVDEGYEDKIVIAHDIHTKHRLMKYGGHGYSHILLNIVPLMMAKGFSKQTVDKILINNPKEWLTYK